MPRSVGIVVENQFAKGLITEATGLNYPEQSCTETFNCVFEKTGEVTRRPGIDFEENFDLLDTEIEENAVTEFLWTGVAQTGEISMVVLQVGTIITFFLIDGNENVGANLQQFTIDITTYAAPGATSVEMAASHCSFASGNGMLFIAHPFMDPIFVNYDIELDTVEIERITIRIRDVRGLPQINPNTELPMTPNHRPGNTEITQASLYNLLNQGWYSTCPCTPDGQIWVHDLPLRFWRTLGNGLGQSAAPVIGDRWPSEADIWWAYKGPLIPFLNEDGFPVPPIPPAEAFSMVSIGKADLGNTPAPKGHFILDAFAEDRYSEIFKEDNMNTLFGTIGDILTFPSNPAIKTDLRNNNAGKFRPSQIAFFAGRVWYAGVDTEEYNTQIWFSQILEGTKGIERCYQSQDPTSEISSDLLPSDGGVLVLPDVAKIVKLFVRGNNLFAFGSNGIIYKVGGSNAEGLGFTANDYSLTVLDRSVGALSANSFVDVQGVPMWWTHSGIYTVSSELQSGDQIQSLSETTIQTFFENIPVTELRWAKGAYNPREKIVQWLFRSTESTTVEGRYEYDRILNLNIVTGAFYVWTLPEHCSHVAGILCIRGEGLDIEDEVVVDNSGDTVVDETGEIVTVGNHVRTDIEPKFKYITFNDCIVGEPDPEEGITLNAEFLGFESTLNGNLFPGSNAILFGEDGEFYSWADDETEANNNIVRFSGGTATILPYSTTQIRTDVEAELGVLYNGAFTNNIIIVVPFTAYFYQWVGGSKNGNFPFDTNWAVLALYKIDSNGDIIFVAAQEWNCHFSHSVGVGLHSLHAQDFKGEPQADPLGQELLVEYFNATQQGEYIMVLPSVYQFLLDSGTSHNDSLEPHFFAFEADLLHETFLETGPFFGGVGVSADGLRTNSCFFLPISTDGVTWDNLVCTYISKADADTINASPGSYNSTLVAVAAIHTQGAVIGKELDGNTDWAVLNGNFLDENGDPLIPFDDLGNNLDGSAGDSAFNDWANPTIQHDPTTGLSFVIWARGFTEGEINGSGIGLSTRVIMQLWNPTSQSAAWFDMEEGGIIDTVSNLGADPGDRYDYSARTIFPFLNADRTILYGLMWPSAVGDVHAIAMFKFGDVVINVEVPSAQLIFSEFNNDVEWLDWVKSGSPVDFDSTFTTAPKLRGDALKKFQNNYFQVYCRNPQNAVLTSAFDVHSRWNYASSADTGQWSSVQRVSMEDLSTRDFVRKRLKMRGHGLAQQLHVKSVTGRPFNIIGWSTYDSVNERP